jgi:hypothetical protein
LSPPAGRRTSRVADLLGAQRREEPCGPASAESGEARDSRAKMLEMSAEQGTPEVPRAPCKVVRARPRAQRSSAGRGFRDCRRRRKDARPRPNGGLRQPSRVGSSVAPPRLHGSRRSGDRFAAGSVALAPASGRRGCGSSEGTPGRAVGRAQTPHKHAVCAFCVSACSRTEPATPHQSPGVPARRPPLSASPAARRWSKRHSGRWSSPQITCSYGRSTSLQKSRTRPRWSAERHLAASCSWRRAGPSRTCGVVPLCCGQRCMTGR